MKILQLVTKRQYRGAEVFAANLSEELIALGNEIVFAGLYKNVSNSLFVEGAENIDLIEKKNSAFSISLLKKIIELIRTSNPDVVQCNGSDTLKYMVAASVFVPEVPIVYRNISMISEWVDSEWKKWLYKRLFERVAHVSSVGDEALADFIKIFNYPKEKTSVIRRGIPIIKVDSRKARKDLEDEFAFDPEDKVVIHVGNFSPEKNHIFLINVFRDLKESHPEIKLILVGNGTLFKKIQEEINKHRLEKSIFLAGFRKDIPQLLAAADLFVLCSRVEGVPGVILEAGMQKKPSVATNVGGVKEVLLNSQTGFIIDNFNKEKFKNKIIELCGNEELRKRMGEKAFALVIKQFNPVKNATEFEKLYRISAGIKGRNEKLKILQIIQKKQYRGAEVFCCQLSNELIRDGHEVKVLSIFEGDADLPFMYPVNSLSRNASNRFWDLKGWWKLANIIKEFSPDVIQANAADTLKYTVFSKMIFKWKAPLVFRNASASSYYIKNRFSQKINSYLLKKVDLIISVSQASKADLNFTFTGTESKSIVIPIGTDSPKDASALSNFNVYNKEDANIVHVGSFTSEKNHLGLLRIFSEVKNFIPQAKLHLVGSGPLQFEIRDLANKKGLISDITFHGEITNPSLHIKFADVLVLPSKIEGLPGVILEAMAHKTPVVAYDVGGVSEIVDHKSGDLIEKDNEDLFSKKVVELLKCKNSSRIDYAYNLVRTNYINDIVAKDFISNYYALAENS